MAPAKKSTGSMHFSVMFYDTIINYGVPVAATCNNLVLKCCEHYRVHEPWWFGLMAKNDKGNDIWIPNDKKLSEMKLQVGADGFIKAKFRIKFYPICIKSEVIQSRTKRIFYQDLRQLILKEEIYADPTTHVNLAALHMQITKGSISRTSGAMNMLKSKLGSLVPKGVVERHKINEDKWHEMILGVWNSYECFTKEDSLLEAISIITDLDMYGVRYYEIENKRGTKLWLGVDIEGMMIYSNDDKMVPKVALAWTEINTISYVDKKFKITPMDKAAPTFQMFSCDYKKNQQIMHICIGNHVLYLSRRKPDTAEVKEQKEKAQKVQEADSKNSEYAQRKGGNEFKEIDTKLDKINDMALAGKNVDKLVKEVETAYKDILSEVDAKVKKLEEEKDLKMKQNKVTETELNQAINSESHTDKIDASYESGKNSEIASLEAQKAAAISETVRVAEELERTRLELEALKIKQKEDQEQIKSLQAKKTKTLRKNPESKESLQSVNNVLANCNKARLEADKKYEEIQKNGINKHATLKLIRKNNAKMRIDQFEAL